MDTLPLSPSFQRYKVFLESTLAIFDEIRGDNELNQQEKSDLVILLTEIQEGARITKGILQNKSPAELLGIKGNGIFDLQTDSRSDEEDSEWNV